MVWYAALLLLVVMSCETEGQRALVRTLMWAEKEVAHDPVLLNKLIKRILPTFHCLQTYIDGTRFAGSFLEDLNQAEEIVPLILNVEWSDITACKGFILIAENFLNAKELLRGIPRYGEHRLLIVLQGPTIVLNQALTASTDIFLDADVALVASGDMSTGYIMAQPKRTFVKYSKLKSWKYSDQGPKNFNGREIQFITYNCTVFSQIGPISKNGTPAWVRGVEIELIQDITDRLGLVPQYTATQTPRDLGSLWYEKQLMEKKVNGTDMAFCGILMSSKKMNKDVIMSVPLTLVCLKWLVPRPIAVSSEWDGIFQPFEPELWFVITLVVLVMSFILQRFAMGTSKDFKTKELQKYEGLGVSFIQTISILVMTNIPRSSPDQGAIRHLITWWALFTLVITTCYSSGLVTHLTNQKFTKTPESFEDLVKGKYKWTMKSKPPIRELFDIRDETQMAWRNRYAPVASRIEHIRRLLKDKKETLWGYKIFDGFTLPEYDLPDFVMDGFQVTNHCVMEYFIGFAIREGCPFENPINRYIQTYNEAGLVHPLFSKIYWERHKEHHYTFRVMRQTRGKLGEPTGLKIRHLLGIFLVWGLGTGFSLLIFFLELAQKCWI